VTFFVIFSFYVFVGVKAVKFINDDNASIGTTIGKIYRDFKQASELPVQTK